MNESSRIDFEKLSLGRLSTFVDILRNGSPLRLSHLKESYSRQSSNFDEVLAFLNCISAITIEGEIVSLNISRDGKLSETILPLLFRRHRNSLTDLERYVKNFYYSDSVYTFKPQQSENLYTSGIRNLLIELDFLEWNRVTGEYFITELGKRFVKDFYQTTSAIELEKILKKQDEVGLQAEKVVIEFEKEQLRGHPELVHLVQHTSLDDVGAGYDIESVQPHGAGGHTRKFIEVKAVSSEGDFYWSPNELETAKQLKDRYYLYLLPSLGKGRFDLENLSSIQDPYKSIFEDGQRWDRECVMFHLRPKQ